MIETTLAFYGRPGFESKVWFGLGLRFTLFFFPLGARPPAGGAGGRVGEDVASLIIGRQKVIVRVGMVN